MQDWKSILLNLYTPEVGSLWVAPNEIWKNGFAANKSKDELHPTVVGKINNDNKTCRIIPGTSKEYQKGTCVYKVKLKNDDDCPYSHFLLKLWMSYSVADLRTLNRGWNGVDRMNDEQVKGLIQQIKFCYGINV